MKLTAEVSEILDRANKKSESVLAKLRTAAMEMFGDDQSIIIGVNDRYARREVTSGSDVDVFFFITLIAPRS